MKKIVELFFLVLISVSCSNNKILIFRNNSDNTVYIIDGTIEDPINLSNHWLFEYLKSYNDKRNDKYRNLREIVKSKDFLEFNNLEIDTKDTASFKWYFYVIKYDTLVSIMHEELDSNWVSRALLKKYIITFKDWKSRTLEIDFK